MQPLVRRFLLAVVSICATFLALYLPGAARRADPGPPAPSGPPPRLVAAEQEHDFGEVLQGSTVRHVFVIRNLGPGTARVERVSSSCGCTAALLSASEIPAGGEARLEAAFSSGSMKGAFRKSISVSSDDPASPLRLHVKGSVRPLLSVEPGTVDFGIVRPGQSARRTLVLRPAVPGGRLRPTRPIARDMPVSVSDPRPGPGGSWSMDVVARPTAPTQVLWGRLDLPTGDARVPTVAVQVRGRVVP